jgi:ribosome biogenesis GTPase / thiamine phosphate phosphatase
MRGKVYKSTGSWYVVKTTEGEVWNARLKGIFKLDGITSTNPVSVGDNVEMEPENVDEKTATITVIYDRRNYINRQSPAHKMHHHIVAANIDQSLLLVTLKEPRTSEGFIDRWLVTCEAYHVPAILLFNKADLYRKKEEEKFDAWKSMYEAIGYRVIRMSVETGEGVVDVKGILQGRISLLSGHSGVGKSSFLNAIFPALRRKTQDVSGWSGKGIHTTTFAEMFDLPVEAEGGEAIGDGQVNGIGGGLEPEGGETTIEESRSGIGKDGHVYGRGGGQVIDTPGMREFGLVDISRAELSGYFPEMRALAGQCQFNNCLHMEEPGCVVKEAVQRGLIHMDRYVSYCTILDSIGEKHY